MKSIKFFFSFFATSIMFTAAMAQASSFTGTVTNKTSGKPSVGDVVELVDVQAGMKVTSHTTTDGSGHYVLNEPGSGPYLVRATHQGAGYFIAAPPGSGQGNISVFDTSPKVNGVSVEDDVLQIESENGQLDVAEQFVIHNTSSPRVTQFSKNTFEFVLPAGAILEGAEATRPSGLPTIAVPLPLSQKGHYTLNVPIQPDEGEAQTLFVLRYHLPYTGSFQFSPKLLMTAENYAVQMPKAMTFTPGPGANFQPVQPPSQGPAVLTFLAKNVAPGKPIDFTVSGNGSLPREDQPGTNGPQPGGGQDNAAAAGAGGQPGGGIGTPINTPDPLTKFKWWILGGLVIVLVAAAGFLLRKPATASVGADAAPAPASAAPAFVPAAGSSAPKQSQLLNVLKEELFSLESEKINGTITPEEFAKVKEALETVLKRALKGK